MKKAIVACFMAQCLLVGCAHIETTKLEESTITDLSLVQLSASHWYDPETMIVYIWNGDFNSNAGAVPSAYIAPNGLPYKYDKVLDCFVEINPLMEWGLSGFLPGGAITPDDATKAE